MFRFSPFILTMVVTTYCTASVCIEIPMEMVSVGLDQVPGNDNSTAVSVSNDGQMVSMTSLADNLVKGDTSDDFDFSYSFIRNRSAADTDWVLEPVARHRPILEPILSADGRFTIFNTGQTNLIPGDTSIEDWFRKDLATDEIVRVNQPESGGNSDGRVTETAGISADGQFVAFSSTASDLVAGDTDGGLSDVFVRDMNSQMIEMISVTSTSEQTLDGRNERPQISADGTFVAFASTSTGLGLPSSGSGIFLRDRLQGTTERVTIGLGGAEPNGVSGFGVDGRGPAVSADGRFVLFVSEASNLVVGDTNGRRDVFLYDRELAETQRISVTANGEEYPFGAQFPSMSDTASRIVFNARSETGQDLVVVNDRTSGKTFTLNTSCNGEVLGDFNRPQISRNGDYIVASSIDDFQGTASNGTRDAFIFDLSQFSFLFKDGFEDLEDLELCVPVGASAS